jgi:hypothetical protein
MTSAVVRGADCPPFPRWAGTVLPSASAARRTGPQGCDRGPPRRVEPDPDRTITSSPRRPDATLLPLPLAARLRRRGRGRQVVAVAVVVHAVAVRCIWGTAWPWPCSRPSPALSRVLCPRPARAHTPSLSPLAAPSSPPPCSLSAAGGTLGGGASELAAACCALDMDDSHHRSPSAPSTPSSGGHPPSTTSTIPMRRPPSADQHWPRTPSPMLYPAM